MYYQFVQQTPTANIVSIHLNNVLQKFKHIAFCNSDKITQVVM